MDKGITILGDPVMGDFKGEEPLGKCLNTVETAGVCGGGGSFGNTIGLVLEPGGGAKSLGSHFLWALLF